MRDTRTTPPCVRRTPAPDWNRRGRLVALLAGLAVPAASPAGAQQPVDVLRPALVDMPLPAVVDVPLPALVDVPLPALVDVPLPALVDMPLPALVDVPWRPAPLHAGAHAAAALQARPRRQTRRGAKIGAIAGSIAGLGIGSFIALFCRIESGPCDQAIPYITVLGGVSGAIGGAIIGAAIPAEAPPAGAAPPVAARRIGSASLSVGAAHARIQDMGGVTWLESSGVAVRGNVYAELRPWLGLGPEGGIAAFGDVGRIRHVAVAARATLPLGRLSPYISGNLGAYQSTGPSLEYLGGGIGVGARWLPGGGRGFLDVDARLSGNVQHIEPTRMRGVYVGGGLYW